jgi:multicomponent Na+:H+ antiporter subunit G
VSAADVLAAALLVIGVLLTLTAAIGILRFPDVLTRMHSATKPQVLGLLVVLVALALRLDDARSLGILALVGVFQLVTSPVASHMVGRASFREGHSRSELVVDELTDGPLPGPDEAAADAGPAPGAAGGGVEPPYGGLGTDREE